MDESKYVDQIEDSLLPAKPNIDQVEEYRWHNGKPGGRQAKRSKKIQ